MVDCCIEPLGSPRRREDSGRRSVMGMRLKSEIPDLRFESLKSLLLLGLRVQRARPQAGEEVVALFGLEVVFDEALALVEAGGFLDDAVALEEVEGLVVGREGVAVE